MDRNEQVSAFYRKRDSVLRSIGFANYGEYMRSPLWKSIRSRVLTRDRFSCNKCRERAWSVHHQDYEYKTMTGRNISALFSVCKTCHDLCHVRHDGSHALAPEATKAITRECQGKQTYADPTYARLAKDRRLKQFCRNNPEKDPPKYRYKKPRPSGRKNAWEDQSKQPSRCQTAPDDGNTAPPF